MVDIRVQKLNEDAMNWLKKHKIKYTINLANGTISMADDVARIFKETWCYEYHVKFSDKSMDHIKYMLNDFEFGSRRVKYTKRKEFTNWCHEHEIRFQFDCNYNKQVRGIKFSKEHDLALFLLTWSQ